MTTNGERVLWAFRFKPEGFGHVWTATDTTKAQAIRQAQRQQGRRWASKIDKESFRRLEGQDETNYFASLEHF